MRIGVAAGVGCVVATIGYLLILAAIYGFDDGHITMQYFRHLLFSYLIPVTFAAALIGAVMYRTLAGPGDGECRCRRCGYILKGLSRAECPECGEAI